MPFEKYQPLACSARFRFLQLRWSHQSANIDIERRRDAHHPRHADIDPACLDTLYLSDVEVSRFG